MIGKEKRKYLIVVDMQNDFINGALGTQEAQAIVPKVVEKIKSYSFKGPVIYTMDTHNKDYLLTQEGKNLPVPHCIVYTEGWELANEIKVVKEPLSQVLIKPTFGCKLLAEFLESQADEIEEIELVGLCTDICVVSNALLLKAYLPEIPITVDSSCCAGVTPAKHEAALETMRSCQINVI